MRSLTCVVLLFTLCFLIAVSPAQQAPPTAVPNLISFGGTLHLPNSSGASSTRIVGVMFSIYSQQEGGAPLWMETQNVTVDASGHYNVLLGNSRAEGIPADLFSAQQERWLGVQVQGQPEQPRIMLVSVPYAFKALEADRLSGHKASEFVTTDALHNAVQQELQATGVATVNQATANATGANSGASSAVVTNPATNFVDTTTNQVVLVQQKGTGVALNAAAGSNSAITAATTSGSVPAISGTSSSTTGTGVSGIASSSSGATFGINGQSSSTSGTGVMGKAQAVTGSTVGVLGSSQSTSGTGVSATATATSGTTVGLKALVSSGSGTAAVIQNTASGKLISGRSGTGTGTEKFAVDGAGNVTASGVVMATGNASGLQLISKVATGTAPLQVTSTTQVPNLNASLLAGNPASAFAPASGSGSYIQNRTTAQSANFNISGNGALGGTLSAANVSTSNNYQIGGNNVLSAPNTNLFLGYSAGAVNTSGIENIFIGRQAGQSNTTASGNTFIGFFAGYSNSTGGGNTFVGLAAGQNNTAGGNVFVGNFAGLSNTTGIDNTFVGTDAGSNNISGNTNTFIGFLSGRTHTDGGGNTFVGDESGSNSTTGGSNVLIGGHAGNSIVAGFNNIDIGWYAGGAGDESNTVRIGTMQNTATYIAGIYGATASGGISVYVNSNGQLGTATSSRRFKEQIADMGDGSNALIKLRPVTFLYKPEYDKGPRTLQYGLIAEEVAEVYPDLVAYDADGKPYTVKYQYLAPMLLNEVQKQYRRAEAEAEVITQQEDKIEAQTKKINELEQRLSRLEEILPH